jgi:tRNA(Arg) A34 adenosine deaminase TadA
MAAADFPQEASMSCQHPDPASPRADIRAVARRDFLFAGAAMAAGTIVPATTALAEAATPSVRPPQAVTEQDREYMAMALKQMRQAGVLDKTGGPFGAVVVLDGKILATAGNSVMRDKDPSAHAEVNAMRDACRKIGNPHIEGAVLYSSCEPCPMCYSTAYWARVGKIFYAASWTDYADLFDDSNIAKDMQFPYEQRQVALQQIMRPDAQKVWDEFRQMPDKARY